MHLARALELDCTKGLIISVSNINNDETILNWFLISLAVRTILSRHSRLGTDTVQIISAVP